MIVHSTTPSAEAAANPTIIGGELLCTSPEDTFALGERIGRGLNGGEVILLFGGLGAGKTLLAKGILHGIGFDSNEVTSPSFTLVNLYQAERFDVYHIDLWRLDAGNDAAAAVGLDDMLENESAVKIIEWADRLHDGDLPEGAVSIHIKGDGDEPREIRIRR
jgi:tRNA threonylcarbamoyladenosine biosynthesis protein TsaE